MLGYGALMLGYGALMLGYGALMLGYGALRLRLTAPYEFGHFGDAALFSFTELKLDSEQSCTAALK